MKSIAEHLLAEDVCLQKFGKVLFGDVLGGEKDTPYEKALSNKLRIFFGLHGQFSERDKLVDAFRELKKCTGHFPKELSPNTGIIYRGVRRTATDLIKVKDWKYVDQTKEMIVGTVKYESRYPIQSWTTNSMIAWGFASSGVVAKKFQQGEKVEGGYYPCVFMGVVNKNDLLFSSDFIERFKAKAGLGIRNEFEIVRISNEPFTCKVMVRMKDLNRPLGKYKPIDHRLNKHLTNLGIDPNAKNTFVRP